MGHFTTGSLEMKMDKRINNDERNPEFRTVEKMTFYACVKLHRNLITRPNCSKKKNGKSVFLVTLLVLFGCNLNIY